MDIITFNELVDGRVKTSAGVLKEKGQRYTRHGDRMHNFKEISSRQKLIPEKALKVLVCKHEVNLDDLVNDLASLDWDGAWSPLLDEIFNDAHNYLYLLEGLIKDRAINQEVKSEKGVARRSKQVRVRK
jgi:hypothetical protein